jgi:hypothetical protein
MVTDTAVILPLFHEMTEKEQDWIADCIEQSTNGIRG